MTTRKRKPARRSLISVSIKVNRKRKRRRILNWLISRVKDVRKAGQEAKAQGATRRGRKTVPLGQSMKPGSARSGNSPWTPPDDPWTRGAPGGARWGGDRRGVVLEPEELEPQELDEQTEDTDDDNADPSGVAGGAV